MKKAAFWVLSFLNFMMILYAPLEVYLTNKSEWWFRFTDFIWGVVGLFFVVELCCVIIAHFLKEKAAFAVALIGGWLAVSLYFQGTYAPCDYGVLNGEEIVWGDYWQYGIISILVFALVLVICFCAIKWKGKEIFGRCIQYLSMGIIVIQVITLTTLLIQNWSIHPKSMAVLDKNMNIISKNKNVIMLVLDSFDAGIFNEVIANNPQVSEILSDFTYYPDTLGAYPTTKGAIPQIVTGIWCENKEEYNRYLDRAYKETELWDVLAKNGYTANLYTNPYYLAEGVSDKTENVVRVGYKVSSKSALTQKLYQLACYRYFPHQLKKYFWIYSGDFDQYKSVEKDYGQAFRDGNVFFYEMLKEGFVLEENNQFKFYHLHGTHMPFSLNRYVEDVEETTSEETGLGCVEIMNELIHQLRDAGVYENTAIIILADHGLTGFHQNPLFLLKDFGESNQQEMVISDETVSFGDLQGILNSLITNDSDALNDIIESDSERRYLYYSWDGNWKALYLPDITEYFADGPASDRDSLVESGNVYKNKDEDQDEDKE